MRYSVSFTLLFIFVFIVPVYASDQNDRKGTEKKEDISDKYFDGDVLWQIFDESHVPASKEINPPRRAMIKRQKRFMFNTHFGRRRGDNWLFGAGGEIRLGNIVFPITLGTFFDVSKNKNGFLSLGINVHFPGNLLSSNTGTGVIRNVLSDDTTSYYGLFGVELLNIVYGEYEAVRKKPDIFRVGLRFYI